MASDKKMHVTVITPSKKVFDEDATSAVVTASDGEMGFLPGHAPLVATLGMGEIKISRADGSKRRFVIRGGFVQVMNNTVSILTPESSATEDLNTVKLDEEMAKLKAAPAPEKKGEKAELEKKVAWVAARQKALHSVAENKAH